MEAEKSDDKSLDIREELVASHSPYGQLCKPPVRVRSIRYCGEVYSTETFNPKSVATDSQITYSSGWIH